MAIKSNGLSVTPEQDERITWLVKMDLERQEILAAERVDDVRLASLVQRYLQKGMERTAKQVLMAAAVSRKDPRRKTRKGRKGKVKNGRQ